MQSAVVYGRLLARVIIAGFNTEFPYQIPWRSDSSLQHTHINHARDFHLVTASSGISKSPSSVEVLKKWAFGDDACFIARHKLADVIGKCFGMKRGRGAKTKLSCAHVFLFGEGDPVRPRGVR